MSTNGSLFEWMTLCIVVVTNTTVLPVVPYSCLRLKLFKVSFFSPETTVSFEGIPFEVMEHMQLNLVYLVPAFFPLDMMGIFVAHPVYARFLFLLRRPGIDSNFFSG